MWPAAYVQLLGCCFSRLGPCLCALLSGLQVHEIIAFPVDILGSYRFNMSTVQIRSLYFVYKCDDTISSWGCCVACKYIEGGFRVLAINENLEQILRVFYIISNKFFRLHIRHVWSAGINPRIRASNSRQIIIWLLRERPSDRNVCHEVFHAQHRRKWVMGAMASLIIAIIIISASRKQQTTESRYGQVLGAL